MVGATVGTAMEWLTGRSDPGINSLDTTEHLRLKVDLMAWMDLKIPGIAKDELNMSSNRRHNMQHMARQICRVRLGRFHCQADEVTVVRAIAARTGRITEAVVLIR